MPDFLAKAALMPQGWAEDVLIKVDEAGWIVDVRPEQSATSGTILDGPVLPGMPNLHSHAFQYAMAGLAEHSEDPANSFWNWRKTMYGFLDTLGPEELERIATCLYTVMLKAGYTQVAEFHYLHHRPDGSPHEDPAHLSRCMIRAAKAAGIGITLLPVLYAHGGFGGQAPESGQRRFINTPEQIVDMVTTLDRDYKADPQVRIGLALHSLRATTPEMIAEVVKAVRSINPQMPIHIHAAEQIQEVEDCKAWSGQRPVEWLLENNDVDPHWCLIHATHMTEEETRALALSGAVAGLCPTTEANLGDGLFNLPSYLRHGGRFGIGSDSHISVNMVEELRWLEYGQRLNRRQRLIARMGLEQHIGDFLYRAGLEGGAQALGTKTGKIAAGHRADFIVLDKENPSIKGRSYDLVLDTMVFATNSNPVRDVYVGGRAVVKNFENLRDESA
ncbi:MAG: formimidoylglutamate deiminase [Micavibrio aeruginosavorus]|uniref:Formimidoylglutamate deiminase n=1 Tax=Micavibrio aeruginosavorus TaxID=349221 RepID=A0A7T5UGJ1_9BACT|nr:MAG: formimidoylglutamate deiminase [Micavibrio aeruginosavorus]